MVIYGAGFATIFLLFAAMYWRAARRVTEPASRHEARVQIGHSFVYVFVAAISMALAVFGGGNASAVCPGVAYGLIGPFQGLYHVLADRYWKPPAPRGVWRPPRLRQKAREARRADRVAGEHRARVLHAEVADGDLAEDVAEVGGDREVAAFVDAAPAPARASGRRPCRPCTAPPTMNIALAWPWSVPRLPFSATARPNSDMVRMTTSCMREPRSVTSAAMPCAKSSRRLPSWPVGAAFVDVVVPAAPIRRRRPRGRRRP